MVIIADVLIKIYFILFFCSTLLINACAVLNFKLWVTCIVLSLQLKYCTVFYMFKQYSHWHFLSLWQLWSVTILVRLFAMTLQQLSSFGNRFCFLSCLRKRKQPLTFISLLQDLTLYTAATFGNIITLTVIQCSKYNFVYFVLVACL